MLKNRFNIPIGERVNPFMIDMKKEKVNFEFQGYKDPTGLGATISWIILVNLLLGLQFMMFVNIVAVILLYLLLEDEQHVLFTEFRIVVQSSQKTGIKKGAIYAVILLNLSLATYFISNPDILIIERILHAVQSPEPATQIYLTVFSNGSNLGDNPSFSILIANIVGMSPFFLKVNNSMRGNSEIYLQNVYKAYINQVQRYINLKSLPIMIASIFLLFFLPSIAISIGVIAMMGIATVTLSEKEVRIVFYGNFDSELMSISIRGDYLEMVGQILFKTFDIEDSDFYSTAYPANLYPPNSAIYTEIYGNENYIKIGKTIGFVLFLYLLFQVYRIIPATLIDAWILFLQLLIIAITTLTFWLNIDKLFELDSRSPRRVTYAHNTEIHSIRSGKKVWMIKNSGVEGISSQKNSLSKFSLIQLNRPTYSRRSLLTYLVTGILTLITLFLIQWIRFGIINITGLSILFQYYFTSILETFVLSIINDKVGIVVLGIIAWFFVVYLSVIIGRYFHPSVELRTNAGDNIRIQLPNLTSVQKAIYGSSMTLKGDNVISKRPGLYIVRINWPSTMKYKLFYNKTLIENGDHIRVGVVQGKAQFTVRLQALDGSVNELSLEVMRGQELRKFVDERNFISCKVVDVRN